MTATTSGIVSWVAVRRQLAGNGRTVSASVKAARSFSSIRCCVPILVALSRPERIQRRTVSGSRFVRRAASGTVSTVVAYYNTSTLAVQQPGRKTVLDGGPSRHSANTNRDSRTAGGHLLTARFRVRIPAPEPIVNSKPGLLGRGGSRLHGNRHHGGRAIGAQLGFKK